VTRPILPANLRSAKPLARSIGILDALTVMSPEGMDHLRAIMSFDGAQNWEGTKVVPPGSFLEDILELFHEQTDIPLEMPLVAAISHVSGLLNVRGAKYLIGNQQCAPVLWTVALAPSGSGKTIAADTVDRWLSDACGESIVPMLANASSAAQFVVNIKDRPRGLWIRDEFGQFLSQVQNLQHMEEIKDILLRAYSGSPIERRTRELKIEIRDHALSLLGITVEETFLRQIGVASLVDGFAQRFNYILAERDPRRQLIDYPIYFDRLGEPGAKATYERMRRSWLAIVNRPDLHGARFDFEDDAIQLFKDGFRSLFSTDIPASFYRRVMFSTFAYATVFHVIAAEPGTTIRPRSIWTPARTF
jgi:hypothetical protein